MKECFLERYDNIEVHPCVALDEAGEPTQLGNENGIVSLEQTDDAPLEDIYCWSIYGHLVDGGLECLADCTSREVADTLARMLHSAGKYTYAIALSGDDYAG